MEHLEVVYLPRYKVQGWEIEQSHKHSLWYYKISVSLTLSIFLHNTYHNVMIHYVTVCFLIVYLSTYIRSKSFFLFAAISSEDSTVPSQNKVSINICEVNEWIIVHSSSSSKLDFLKTVHCSLKWGNGTDWGKYEWLTDLFIVFISSTQKPFLKNPWYTQHLKYLQNLCVGLKKYSDDLKQREGIFRKSIAFKIGGPNSCIQECEGISPKLLARP